MSKVNSKILGHNSFYGINHINYTKGQSKNLEFNSDINKIIDLLKFAIDNNINQFMTSTIDESYLLFDEINNKNKYIKDNLEIHVLLPYINKYVRKTNELGITGTLKEILNKSSLLKNIKYGFDALTLFNSASLQKIIPILIDLELKYIKDFNLKSIILHDSLTDILVALRREDIILFYAEYISKNYKTRPGFATKNIISFLNLTKNININDAYILTHVNKIGFEMNPSQKEVESTIQASELEIICMSVLASGVLDLTSAIQYLENLNVKRLSAVIGCSTKKHIEDFAIY